MQYEDLNDHFKERIRSRVHEKMLATHDANVGEFEPSRRDYAVGVIILIADENDLFRAAKRLYELKLSNPETAITFDQALSQVATVHSRFGPEISMFYDLYQLQRSEQVDLMDIIAQMEIRLIEDLEQPALELPLEIQSTSLRRIL